MFFWAPSPFQPSQKQPRRPPASGGKRNVAPLRAPRRKRRNMWFIEDVRFCKWNILSFHIISVFGAYFRLFHNKYFSWNFRFLKFHVPIDVLSLLAFFVISEVQVLLLVLQEANKTNRWIMNITSSPWLQDPMAFLSPSKLPISLKAIVKGYTKLESHIVSYYSQNRWSTNIYFMTLHHFWGHLTHLITNQHLLPRLDTWNYFFQFGA